MTVRFDQVVTDKDQGGVCIMIKAKNTKELIVIQKALVSALSGYADYVEPHSQKYEENFDPHITIGDELSDQQYAEALEYLKDGFSCEGIIREVVLVTVNKATIEESFHPENQTVFNL